MENAHGIGLFLHSPERRSNALACIHVFRLSLPGITRSTQFPEIGEKEWTYNRMLETSLRDRGFFGRVVSLRLMVLREGIHVMKYLPLTPLYAEETLFQVCTETWLFPKPPGSMLQNLRPLHWLWTD